MGLHRLLFIPSIVHSIFPIGKYILSIFLLTPYFFFFCDLQLISSLLQKYQVETSRIKLPICFQLSVILEILNEIFQHPA